MEYGEFSDDTIYLIQDEMPKEYELKTWTSNDVSASIYPDIEEIYEKILKKFSLKPQLVHQCNNCGANLELDPDKHVFCCKYCGAVYLIGTQQLMSIY